MSISRQGDYHDVSCDYCGFEETFETDNDWNVLMQCLKDAGWWKLKDKETGIWTHKCPECVSRGKKTFAQGQAAKEREEAPPDSAYDEDYDNGADLDTDDPFGEDL